jgi:hypothetical protein
MGVKAVTITLPEDLDAAAAAEAKRLGTSKSELIRRGLEAVLPADAVDGDVADPWTQLAGFGSDGLSTEPGEVDRIVYEA